MELIGYDVTLEPTGLNKITLNCVGSELDFDLIRKVYNAGGYQPIVISRLCEKENKTMNKETRTFTAEELCRIETEAYNRGYERGRKVGFHWGASTHAGFTCQDKDLKIKKVIFNDPATIVFWSDGTKTVAKAHGDDKFDKEVGLTVCIAKKALGNRRHFDAVFKKWIK